MTTAQRHLKLLYWRRVLAWNLRRLRRARNAAERDRYTRRISRANREIHALRFPARAASGAATGPDVSNLQASVDFKAIKRAGHAFVFLKAGEGDWTDPTFLGRVKAARAAGLHVGAYHFLRPKAGRMGAQEARYFIANLRAAGLGRGDLRPVLDVEATTLGTIETRVYVQAFARTVERTLGVTPIFYTYASFNGGDWPAGFGRFPLWIAAYQDRQPTVPRPWSHWAAWQFTDKAVVPGVARPCDLSRTDDIARLIA